MLTNITIKNYIIIDLLELDFHSGLTALTGETGAGKSILLGALGLVLGDRADTDSIKEDADFTDIIAEFDIENDTAVKKWLQRQDLHSCADDITECNLRRRINKDGRSRAHINGTPVNLTLLRELGEMLIDIHGQHEHQSLMKSESQRQLLDAYANHPTLLNDINKTYNDLIDSQRQLKKLELNAADRTDRLKLLSFQIEELDALALEENEFQLLSEKHKRLANSEKLIQSTQNVLDSLHENDDSSIQSELARIIHKLQDINAIDERLNPTLTLLEEAQIQIDEAISELNNYSSSMDTDTAGLIAIESRIQTILDIARKHHVDAEALQTLHSQLQDELDDIDHADEKLEELQEDVKKHQQQYFVLAKKLSKNRLKTATTLNKKITAAMQTLGMKGGQFKIDVTSNESKTSATGSDQIEFSVTANTGNRCKALAKVASGGELARISLAIQMITASQNRISTLVFDEVDSGVGGGIAEIVGQHLRQLGSTCQVICITHLPQVASQAHHHMKVHKISRKQIINTHVDPLDDKQRIEEIARMLSGVDITKQSLANAKAMIARVEA